MINTPYLIHVVYLTLTEINPSCFTQHTCNIIVLSSSPAGHNIIATCNAVIQHGGSHAKYTELLHKHQRNPKGPMDLYNQPLTTSHMYGWLSHGDTHKQNWLQGPKHVHVNSEMTRYVCNNSIESDGNTLIQPIYCYTAVTTDHDPSLVPRFSPLHNLADD